MEIEVPVDGHRQSELWSCGPAALKILLSRFDHHISEESLIDLSHSGPAGGTTHEGLESAARKLGYKVQARSEASLEDLKAFLEMGSPVLVDFQGCRGGHYAVVRGYKDGRFELEDPRATGPARHSLEENVFAARWYNLTYPDKRLINRWMMVITP